jgi:LSU ribosomal protein L6P
MKAAYLREEIEIPKGVTITLDGMKVRVKGPKGEIEKDFTHIKGIQMSLSDNKLILETTFADRRKEGSILHYYSSYQERHNWSYYWRI